jgi:YidC/Oxa1 family membrane protein insertase
MALYPLTKSSYISMHKMKQLQPELAKLKEKYGSDKEKMGRETMALYNKNGVSPLGGCLPMLLQMPIWFGLYRAIQNSVELYNEPFMFWIKDLSDKDPFYILPISLGLLMFVQQKLSTPMGTDQMQAKVMLYTLPVVFAFFMLMLPSGLVLYIWVNTLITIFQQKYINSKLDGVPYFKYLLSSFKK